MYHKSSQIPVIEVSKPVFYFSDVCNAPSIIIALLESCTLAVCVGRVQGFKMKLFASYAGAVLFCVVVFRTVVPYLLDGMMNLAAFRQ